MRTYVALRDKQAVLSLILQVKLCDFGFTREYERNKLLQTFCGTVCYSAPEMLKGERYMAHGTGWFCLHFAQILSILPPDTVSQSHLLLLEGILISWKLWMYGH